MLRLILSLLSLLLLSCCTTLTQPSITNNISPTLRKYQLSALTHWHLTGKASFQQGSRVDTANVDWQETWPGTAQEEYTLRLSGPMGIGSVRVHKDTTGVSIIDSQGRQYHGQKASTLLWKISGIHLPIENLIYWIRALPNPNRDKNYPLATYWDTKTGRLQRLEQYQWQIDYLDYAAIGKIELPTRLNITALRSKPVIKAKIHITNWQTD